VLLPLLLVWQPQGQPQPPPPCGVQQGRRVRGGVGPCGEVGPGGQEGAGAQVPAAGSLNP